ncbi:4Fe-4S binding protein [Adlercreutzia equolifaciens]|uniref:4Fe-4S binding protein n=1 Tax=Adlercreutzia equolifaciens TaxID=446660 RepID=UPI0023B07BFE|nr:4Fe-4S binding protein [Adlercreutzia equolifaciens]MDE8701398.1 4Fe-4S binding protein [Adlercreutzia equolifaciens]
MMNKETRAEETAAAAVEAETAVEAVATGAEDAAAVAPKAVEKAPKKKRPTIVKVRRSAVLIIFASVVLGLLLSNGWGTLSAMGYGAITYLCPVGALETLFASHTLIPRVVIALVVALVVIALLGRMFCAWACPVPPLRRLFRSDKKKPTAKAGHGSEATVTGAEGPTSDETCAAAEGAGGGVTSGAPAALPATEAGAATEAMATHAASAPAMASSGCHSCSTCGSCKLPPVGGKRDGLQIDSRHGVLAGAVISSAICGFPVFCLVCPVGLTIALVVCLFRAIFQQDPTVSILVFAAILLVEVVFFRKWCHKFCPIGALMSLVGAKAPVLKPQVDEEKCLRSHGIDCKVCVQSCPEELDPHSARLSECTRCAECVQACPAGAIKLRTRKPVAERVADPAAMPSREGRGAEVLELPEDALPE